MDPFTPKDGYGQVLYSVFTEPPKIIRLDEHRVLKRASTDCRETEAMQYIAANTTIPIPRVYETKWRSEDEFSEIVMDYVPGESLDKVWAKLTHDQRISTCHQLSGYLSQLKNLKGKRIEAANGGSITIGHRFLREGGPFDAEKEFNDFVVETASEHLPPFFQRYARVALADNHEIHFAHGDFSPRNILVDGDGCVTPVLDWDRAGWYPEYWDQNRMLSENPGVRGYFSYIHHMLPFKYNQEILAMGYLLRISGDR